MHTFPASELQRNPAEIQKAALMGPVFLTYHDKPRYVMMSLEAFVRIQGNDLTKHPATYPQAVAARVNEIAETSGGAPSVAWSEISTVDKLVLATVNAPYKRSIDAATLAASLDNLESDQWLVHVATFFTDVAPELVFKFAKRHGISRAKLARTYLATKSLTGEQNRELEADLVPVAPSARSNRRGPRSSSRKGKKHS